MQTRPEDDETSPLEFPFEFKEDIFEDYGNSLKYLVQVRPQEKTTHIEPHEDLMDIEHIQSLSAIMSYEWLTEAELSPEVAWITFPSTILLCQVRGSVRRVHYNLSIGLNIISKEIVRTLYPDMSLTLSQKLLQGPS